MLLVIITKNTGQINLYARKNNESSMKRKALIIGVNSQDGSYLADLSFKKYKIFGTVRNLNNLKKVAKSTKVSLIKLNTFDFTI